LKRYDAVNKKYNVRQSRQGTIITYDILNYAILSIFEALFAKSMTEELRIKRKTIFLPNKNTFIDWP